MELLKKADFSAETDLKERLYQKLFAAPRGRRALSDEEVATLYAAGDPHAAPEPEPKKKQPCP